MATCCINKSGQVVPVYNFSGQTIGELGRDEFFTWVGTEGSLISVYFLGSNGSALYGILKSPPSRTTTSIEQYPYGKAPDLGAVYITFIMRKTMTLYDINGNVVGSVAQGKRVACKSGMGSYNMPYLKAINFAEKRTGGWDPMEDSNGEYGFVDTGLRTSSSRTGIALYGSW